MTGVQTCALPIFNLIFLSLVGAFFSNLSILLTGPLVVRKNLAEIGADATSWSKYLIPVFTSLVSLSLYKYYKKKKILLFVVSFLMAMSILSVIKSGFSAAILILLIGFSTIAGLVLLSKNAGRINRRILIATLCVGVMLTIFYSLILFAPDSTPAYRIKSVISFITGDTSIDINHVSGTRTYLAYISWNTFLSHPLMGVVAYAFIYGFSPIGGHSTLLDMLAQFGLICGIPVIGILLSLLAAAGTIFRYDKSSYLGLVLVGWWTAYFAGCYMDPYLFSGAIDHYVFTFAGITTGLAYHNIKASKQRKVFHLNKLI